MQTSALDTYTEQELMRNINNNLLDRRRTSVFVAHRLQTIADADLIIVLNQGKVAEQGSHSDLMHKRDGLYRGAFLSAAPLKAAEIRIGRRT